MTRKVVIDMPATPRKRTPVKADSKVARPAENRVDETVVNQESLGSGNVVDRNPDPQVVSDPTTGGTYDINKSDRELVDPDREEREVRQNKLRQTEGVMNAKDSDEKDSDDDTDKIKIEFLESGLTAYGRVWKKGEVLDIEDSDAGRQPHIDTEGNAWFDLTADEQKDRYGKVFFEKR